MSDFLEQPISVLRDNPEYSVPPTSFGAFCRRVSALCSDKPIEDLTIGDILECCPFDIYKGNYVGVSIMSEVNSILAQNVPDLSDSWGNLMKVL